ncbi:MAG: dehydrogenase [Deltaproteobacteria bacterium RIFCSPLOWO2_01_44_7]|nr:MAG: dehydrogenase [Deltaproteobacteria bacterium RIFCSPHIGHO2_01_FULL_43_49]OGQ15243.1 MAG: dehydrogenase [Deltaproteobacteria bacterium RIFCSPHIGHO2_02_FULL_44_53]OGQ27134.1 MAG: dehydrogenase [Deltaproteobacteria bacterium RIFCSPHIGHO2_12_FULL_44_21]OGQ31759.1 MAG: dehydrogenase [Deltaproteobacteria bacterium RIFCSPLOWO2_01_FULL_45_74]OGQ42148.1 MAG: dehydrogenase [Deltaproteobacteria bacterium RIFCSPLOWO2_01_44_7]OGQ42960.1 MAG: dehydrogenase [Deltaproteobacteria bacterium RIFCSPLOWO2_0
MPKVKNWQIGREMEYPYEDKRPKKQVAYVFDTNKCIACQTCSSACKTTWTSGPGQESMFWNNTETKPYGFYPKAWDVKLLKNLGEQTWEGDTYTGKTVFEEPPAGERIKGHLPAYEDYANPNVGEDEVFGLIEKGAFFGSVHNAWMFYLTRICNHCTYPACLAACPRKAIYKRDDGIVLVDQTRCRGYKECVKACPYKKVFFNMVTRTSEKCIACYPLLEKGEQPRCVQTCIGKIRLMSWLSKPGEAKEDNPLDYIVLIKKVALPLYPQSGTEPNVYYIPPVHVPREFLLQMFGPGVDEAIQTYKAVRSDPKLLAAFLLFGNTSKIITRFAYNEKEAIGFNEKGEEVVRVPFTEPFFEREMFDAKLQVYRHNTA